jgi:lysozyme family protein
MQNNKNMSSLNNNNFKEAFYRAMFYETGGRFNPNNPNCVNGKDRSLCGTSGGKNDRGGNTKFGIAKNSHPGVDIDSLTMEQAADIYYKEYWCGVHADELDRNIASILFNISCTSGVGKAIKILQTALGVTADGVFGNQTREAYKKKPSNLEGSILRLQVAYYYNIVANNPSQSIFLDGWMRRAYSFNDYLK